MILLLFLIFFVNVDVVKAMETDLDRVQHTSLYMRLTENMEHRRNCYVCENSFNMHELRRNNPDEVICLSPPEDKLRELLAEWGNNIESCARIQADQIAAYVIKKIYINYEDKFLGFIFTKPHFMKKTVIPETEFNGIDRRVIYQLYENSLTSEPLRHHEEAQIENCLFKSIIKLANYFQTHDGELNLTELGNFIEDFTSESIQSDFFYPGTAFIVTAYMQQSLYPPSYPIPTRVNNIFTVPSKTQIQDFLKILEVKFFGNAGNNKNYNEYKISTFINISNYNPNISEDNYHILQIHDLNAGKLVQSQGPEVKTYRMENEPYIGNVLTPYGTVQMGKSSPGSTTQQVINTISTSIVAASAAISGLTVGYSSAFTRDSTNLQHHSASNTPIWEYDIMHGTNSATSSFPPEHQWVWISNNTNSGKIVLRTKLKVEYRWNLFTHPLHASLTTLVNDDGEFDINLP